MTPKKAAHYITVESFKARYPGMKNKSTMHRATCVCGWEANTPRSSGELAQKDGEVHAPKPKRKAKKDAATN